MATNDDPRAAYKVYEGAELKGRRLKAAAGFSHQGCSRRGRLVTRKRQMLGLLEAKRSFKTERVHYFALS